VENGPGVLLSTSLILAIQARQFEAVVSLGKALKRQSPTGPFHSELTMLAYQLLAVVFKSMWIEARTAETIPKSKLIARSAHSVVRRIDGKLFDSTPLADELVRTAIRFIPRLGEERGFRIMRESNIFSDCPCGWST
jgi:hypothetical protein